MIKKYFKLFLIALFEIPLAIIITVMAAPFWGCFEETFKIEAYGHSGPAEWCYLITYLILLILSSLMYKKFLKDK